MRTLVTLALLALAVGRTSADEPKRFFLNPDGKTVEARVVSVEATAREHEDRIKALETKVDRLLSISERLLSATGKKACPCADCPCQGGGLCTCYGSCACPNCPSFANKAKAAAPVVTAAPAKQYRKVCVNGVCYLQEIQVSGVASSAPFTMPGTLAQPADSTTLPLTKDEGTVATESITTSACSTGQCGSTDRGRWFPGKILFRGGRGRSE